MGQIVARVVLETNVRKKDLQWCDLAVLCRNTDPQTGQWFLKLLQSNIPYIYDIDDNFFELPSDTPIGRYHTAPERLNMLREYIRWADLVRVYSKPMFEQSRSLNKNIIQATGPVDWRLLTPRHNSTDRDIIKIVYATSRVNDTLSELFKPALHRVLEKYHGQIEVYFLGYIPSEFKKYPNVFFKPLTLNYEHYLRYFSGAGFDIGLAPLLDDVFHRSKTNLKVREYGACHIAGIYSNVDVYSTTVTNGETGLLVENNLQAWLSAMEELIENRELRIHIQEQAYRFAKDNFSHIAFNQLWYQQMIQTLQHPRENKEYQNIVSLFRQPDHESSSSHNAFLKLRYVSHGVWLYNFLRKKFTSLISGLKSEGIDYLMRTVGFHLETFWMLIKIRLKLFFVKIKSSPD